jgi:hypothetical protein
MPVIDWTAVVRIDRQIGMPQETLNTLGLYVQQYNRINAGVQEGVRMVRAAATLPLRPSSSIPFANHRADSIPLALPPLTHGRYPFPFCQRSFPLCFFHKTKSIVERICGEPTKFSKGYANRQ